jgi:DUF4097 and DUF4098 domain-containing protein YvlB
VRRETFHTPGQLTVDLRVPAGAIEVVAVDGEETTVELDASGWTIQAGSFEDVSALIDGARIELRRRGDGHEVLVDVPHRRRGLGVIFDRANFQLRVTAPHGADVEISTASADVDLRGRLGSFKAQVASGDIRADDLNGRVDVKSASGDVNLQAIGGSASIASASGDIYIRSVHGEATLRSASGDVTVEEAADSLTVQTASGDHRVGSVASGRVALTSASGDQHVGIRSGSRVHLDVKTMSGDATSELEVRDQPVSEDGPSVEVRATSMSGDITIVRAG